ncbi:MAG: hypothetical protein CM15mP1_1890 [Methanobacteriota archaeon]|nr:MAG: hypothetical protein CM15mP1_1890 [Euryarchaeota archaeon]
MAKKGPFKKVAGYFGHAEMPDPNPFSQIFFSDISFNLGIKIFMNEFGWNVDQRVGFSQKNGDCFPNVSFLGFF